MKKFAALSCSIFLTACVADSTQSALQPSHSVEYMLTADAKADAKKAIENANYTLLGFDQRGLTVPGVKASELKQVQTNCAIKQVGGMGDMVRSEEHLKQMKKIHAYSLQYNLTILQTTSCQ